MDSSQHWTLTDGHAGNRRQADALAAALRCGPVQEWNLKPQAPWRAWAPRRFPGATHAFGKEFAEALAHPPRLAIGCGRQAALATRLLRERGSQAVQILDPRIDTRHWDLVIAPQHDGLAGENVISLLGSLNPVDELWLAHARAAFASFADLPQPRTAVLLGGPSKHAGFNLDAFQQLAARLDGALARDGGSILATTSRRTPAEVIDALLQRYADMPGLIWVGEAQGVNPYPGLLAWADRIVVSADSVNMVSEACATHSPVFVHEPASVKGRPQNFLQSLLALDRIRPMDEVMASFPVQPLRETTRVAELVRQRLA